MKETKQVQLIKKKLKSTQVQDLKKALLEKEEQQLSNVDVFGIVKSYCRYEYQELNREITEIKTKLWDLKNPKT